MKICTLFFALAATAAFSGELADQFPKHPKKQRVPLDRFEKPPVYDIKQIGVEHTACLGMCPVFTLVVNSDGTFRYHGENYVKRRGEWHGTVELGELHRVWRYISEMGYFDLADEYTAPVSDLPSTYSMVTSSSRKKIVCNYGELGPAKLSALGDMIDHLLDNAKWKRH
jgi:hypothetical protein